MVPAVVRAGLHLIGKDRTLTGSKWPGWRGSHERLNREGRDFSDNRHITMLQRDTTVSTTDEADMTS